MSKEKHIAFILPDDRVGGAESVMRKIAVNYLSHGFSVHVFFLKKPLGNYWSNLGENCHLYFTGSKTEKFGLYRCSRNLIKASKKHQFELSFSSHVHLIALVSVLMKFRLFKTNFFVTRELTTIFERFSKRKNLMFKFMYFLSLKHTDLKIFQTEIMKSSFKHHFKYAYRFNSIVLHNPIDKKQLEIQAQEQIEGFDFPFVVACGRFIKLKGFDLLIEVFNKLEDENLRLVIIGNGPEKDKLNDLRIHSPKQDRIHFLGHLENPIPYFKKAKLCVLSSRKEGFPNVLLEMMSQNDNVVATKCAGTIDSIPGLSLAESDNLESLELAIRKALQLTTLDLEQNKLALEGYLSKISIENYVSNIEQVLNR